MEPVLPGVEISAAVLKKGNLNGGKLDTIWLRFEEHVVYKSEKFVLQYIKL